jgi:hypothetical protein
MENSTNSNDDKNQKIQKMLTKIMNILNISIDLNSLKDFKENHRDKIENLFEKIQPHLTVFIKKFKNQSIESDDSIQKSKDEQFQELLIEFYKMISNKQEGGFNINETSTQRKHGREQRYIELKNIEIVVNTFLRANNINDIHSIIPILIIGLAIYSYIYVDTETLFNITVITTFIFGILMSQRRGGKSSKKRHTKKNRKTKRRSKTSRRHKHRR